jgi:DNA polymerase IV
VKKWLPVQYMRYVEGTLFINIFAEPRYRRGKSESGDVDIIISNHRPHATKNLCLALVKVLEERGIITHTLTITTATSNREENPKHSFRQRGPLGSGEHGFGLDALDKALVVFLLPKGNTHYTGIHRRVDLIIAPWRAWGTAIVGWTVLPIHRSNLL